MRRVKENVQSVTVPLEPTTIIDYTYRHEGKGINLFETSCTQLVICDDNNVIDMSLNAHFTFILLLQSMYTFFLIE